MNGINEFHIILETHPDIKKHHIETMVAQILLDHPMWVKLKGITLTNRSGVFIPNDAEEDGNEQSVSL
jgi:hypothetical protein